MQKELNQIYRFKPKINNKSKKLDHKRTENCEIPRYEILHELNYVLKEREEELKNYHEELAQEKYELTEGKECTFQPKINKDHYKVNNSK